MTVVLLGIDAFDSGLIDHFNLKSSTLCSHRSMETFSYMQETPYTPEVWATVATGKHPTEHGVTGSGTSQWDNSVVNFVSQFTGFLPLSVRIKLGKFAQISTGAEYGVGETDLPTLFDGEGRVVHNWPGVANGEELASIWYIMFDEPDQSKAEFERKLYGKAAAKFAWAEEMLRHNVPLAGVHVHVADAMGHAYADDESKLRECYEWIDRWVGQIHDNLGEDDDLVILSDHGIVTTFYSDSDDRGLDQSMHSWRAYAASTFDSVPESVFNVREWLDPKINRFTESTAKINLPEEQLRQLGYIE